MKTYQEMTLAERQAEYAALCRTHQEQQALGLEEDACQTAVCAILAQSQDRLPQLRDRLLSAEQ